MLVGLHKTFFKGYFPYIQRFEKILEYNGIKTIRMQADDSDFWSRVKELDLFIFWWRHDNGDWRLANSLIPIVQRTLKVNCLPNVQTCWTYDDKIRQYYLLRALGYPIIDSWVFWDKQKALDWVDEAEYPVVFKLSGGAGSRNVILVHQRSEARKLVKRMFGRGIETEHIPFGTTKWLDFNAKREGRHLLANQYRRLTGVPLPPADLHKNYAYFQKFLAGNTFDTRITVIGRRAFGFRRYTRQRDFRASGSGNIDYMKEGIDPRFLRIAFSISAGLGFQSMAYDFLYDSDRNPSLCEISYTFLDTAVERCTGYWDADLNWHEGHWWPQYFQLMDALDLPQLKQPLGL
jgi:glutathione synthase/RimK-type ligase-like ATP-grasp enzyme